MRFLVIYEYHMIPVTFHYCLLWHNEHITDRVLDDHLHVHSVKEPVRIVLHSCLDGHESLFVYGRIYLCHRSTEHDTLIYEWRNLYRRTNLY